MKFIIIKTELIYQKGSESDVNIIRNRVEVNNIEEHRKSLLQLHGCNKVLFVYKEKAI